MIAGMVVAYDGRPHHVLKITGGSPTYTGKEPATYTLAAVGPDGRATADQVWLEDPMAADMPRINGCGSCGAAPGLPCREGCAVGTVNRTW